MSKKTVDEGVSFMPGNLEAFYGSLDSTKIYPVEQLLMFTLVSSPINYAKSLSRYVKKYK